MHIQSDTDLSVSINDVARNHRGHILRPRLEFRIDCIGYNTGQPLVYVDWMWS